MSDAEKKVQLLAKMFEARKTVKQIVSEPMYSKNIAGFIQLIDMHVKSDGGTRLEAAFKVSKKAQNDGNDIAALFGLAAYIEIIERDASARKAGEVKQ